VEDFESLIERAQLREYEQFLNEKENNYERISDIRKNKRRNNPHRTVVDHFFSSSNSRNRTTETPEMDTGEG